MRRLALALLLLVPADAGAADDHRGSGEGAAVSSPEPPRYPVPLAEPDFTAPGDPFELYDLRYSFDDIVSTTHSFAARVKTGHRGFVGVELQGEDRRLSLEAHRLFLSVGGANGSLDLRGRYRAPRFLLSVAADRHEEPGRDAWRVRPALAVRLSRDLEIVATLDGDSRPPGRFLRGGSLGFLWQRGAHLELTGEYAHSRESTLARYENTRDSGTLAVVAQAGPAELTGRGSVETVEGLFFERRLEGMLGARVCVLPRLLVEGEAEGAFERVVGERSSHYRAAVRWFARPFHLPRTGERARRALALARLAWDRGLNERRVFDADGLRAQRERLSLSRGRDELRDDMRAVYAAQVEERTVPSLGFEIEATRDPLTATRSRTLRATLALPWPPAWPGARADGGVEFLRLDLERERVLSGPGYESIRNGLTFTVSLNREVDLVLRWAHAQPTPLDLIRGIGDRRTIAVAAVYALGR